MLALGFDIASEPVWHAVLEKARDTGTLTITPPLNRGQEMGQDVSVGAFLPIYRNGLPRETLAERRANLHGFVLLVLPMA
jgi:CHASE1-domain containing sensor protein